MPQIPGSTSGVRVALKTPYERCGSDALVGFGCQVRWGSFFWPSPFWPLDDFFDLFCYISVLRLQITIGSPL